MTRLDPDHGGRHRRPHLSRPGGRRRAARARLARGLAGRARRHGGAPGAAAAATRLAWIRAARAARQGAACASCCCRSTCCSRSGRARARSCAPRPDVVLGMGGYVAFPGGMMASLLEPAARAARAERDRRTRQPRALAGVADKVLVAFPQALKSAEWTGNPVRAEIAAIAPPAERYARPRAGRCACWSSAAASARRRSTRRVPQALA